MFAEYGLTATQGCFVHLSGASARARGERRESWVPRSLERPAAHAHWAEDWYAARESWRCWQGSDMAAGGKNPASLSVAVAAQSPWLTDDEFHALRPRDALRMYVLSLESIFRTRSPSSKRHASLRRPTARAAPGMISG